LAVDPTRGGFSDPFGVPLPFVAGATTLVTTTAPSGTLAAGLAPALPPRRDGEQGVPPRVVSTEQLAKPAPGHTSHSAPVSLKSATPGVTTSTSASDLLRPVPLTLLVLIGVAGPAGWVVVVRRTRRPSLSRPMGRRIPLWGTFPLVTAGFLLAPALLANAT